jgi:hypothetical protein
MAADLCKRALGRAAEIVGGREQLARYLDTDLAQLRRWSEAGAAPRRVLRALALLLSYEIAKTYRLRGAMKARRGPTGK